MWNLLNTQEKIRCGGVPCMCICTDAVCSSHYLNDSETTWSLYQLSTATFSCQQVDSHSYMWVSWVWHHIPVETQRHTHAVAHPHAKDWTPPHPHSIPGSQKMNEVDISLKVKLKNGYHHSAAGPTMLCGCLYLTDHLWESGLTTSSC